MKKILILCIFFSAVHLPSEAQFKNLLDKAKNALSGKQTTLSNEDIVAGLKEALAVGSQKGASTLSQVDGFFLPMLP